MRLDSPEDAIAQCFEADVFHADSLVPPNRVRVSVLALPNGPQEATVRIRSSAAIDEPVVSVVVRANCGGKASRRYDFLTELPIPSPNSTAPVVVAEPPQAPAALTDPQSASGSLSTGSSAAPVPPPVQAAPAPVPPRPVTAPQTPSADQPVRPRAAARATQQSPGSAAPRPAAPPRAAAVPPRPRRVTPAPAPATKEAAAPTPKAVPQPPATDAAAAAGKPRLRLEAPAQEQSALRSSTQLSAVPAEDSPQRADAAAAWRALNAQPDDAQKVQALEAQDKADRAARAKSEADLRARLERAERRLDEAENRRFDVTIVYGLLALLLVALLAALYFWNKARQGAAAAANWARNPDSLLVGADGPGIAERAASKTSKTEDLGDDDVDESRFDNLKKAPTSGSMGLGAAAASGAMAAATPERAESAHMRAVNPEEFFDVQQHADFFVSLGQYDQAIEVLRKHIEDHAEMSPMAYLELFKLYHTLSRQSDFNALREEFQHEFNCRIPNFAAFSDEGLSLDDYPAALLSIETAWGEPRVIDTIEANLFRHPGDIGKPFDLAAYRDLLLLHGVARTILKPGDSTFGAMRAARGAVDEAAFQPHRLTRPNFSSASNETYPIHKPVSAPVAAPQPVFDDELDSVPAPLAETPKPSPQPEYDQSLDLDLDLSDSELQSLNTLPSSVAPLSATAPLSQVDIDLPMLELEESVASPTTDAPEVDDPSQRKPAVDSGLIDFDLFDPKTEARIAPKSTR